MEGADVKIHSSSGLTGREFSDKQHLFLLKSREQDYKVRRVPLIHGSHNVIRKPSITYWDTCEFQLATDVLRHHYCTLWMMTTMHTFQRIYRDIQIVLHFLVIFKCCLVLYSMVQNSTASRNILSELWEKMITFLKWKIFVCGQHPSYAIHQY